MDLAYYSNPTTRYLSDLGPQMTPKWVHGYAAGTSFMTWLLLCAGALVTSTGSGLAVPDWPLTYGQFFPQMVGGVLFEHGHRLIAGTVGLMTLGLMLTLLWTEHRRWVRFLGVIAFFAVLTQAALGGLTVLYRLPFVVSVGHACLAHVFFSLTTIITLATSPYWQNQTRVSRVRTSFLSPLPYYSSTLTSLFFLQLVLGALMRHSGAGLAIPDFPLSFGQWIPELSSQAVTIHFAHRLGAFTLLCLLILFVVRILRDRSHPLDLVASVGALSTLVIIQVTLGALTIWLKKPIPITVLHLAIGALCLAMSVILTCQLFRKEWLLGSSERSEKPRRIRLPLVESFG